MMLVVVMIGKNHVYCTFATCQTGGFLLVLFLLILKQP